MKNGLKFTLSFLSLLSASSVQPGNLSYYAEFDTAEWEVDGNVFECSMSHNIPHFGEAVFYREAGETMIFYLQALGQRHGRRPRVADLDAAILAPWLAGA